MNDCPNADIRDRLPDLLHERLDVSMRAAVMAHVDGCVDCRAELELLRGVHGMLMSQTPRVDIDYVVKALPKRAARPVRVAPRRRVWSDWRIAAAVTVLAVGGGSFAVLRQDTAVPDSARVSSALGQPNRGAAAETDSNTRPTANVVAPAEDQIAPGGLATTARLADLDERQLQALLDQIDQLQAVPIAEPEPVTIRVDGKGSSPEGAS